MGEMNDFNNFTQEPQNDKKGMAIASMVLGIVAVVSAFCIPFLAIACGVVGLILGIMSRDTVNGKGMAMAGLVCSIVALGISVIIIILAILAGSIYSAILGTALSGSI